MIYVFDLDGTLINSTERHWRLMKLLLEQKEIPVPECFENDYMAYKSAGHSGLMYLKKCLHLDNSTAEALQTEWIRQIEEDPWLDMDTLYNDVKETLARIKDRILFLTIRNNADGLYRELKRLGIAQYETHVLKHGEKKADILRNLEDTCMMIGDTEDDYNAAEETGCRYYMLNRGFRSADYWKQRGIKSYPDLSYL